MLPPKLDQDWAEAMHILTLCHVVPLAVLAGPERITQALKIIFTTAAMVMLGESPT
jgi:hypothetical protein